MKSVEYIPAILSVGVIALVVTICAFKHKFIRRNNMYFSELYKLKRNSILVLTFSIIIVLGGISIIQGKLVEKYLLIVCMNY